MKRIISSSDGIKLHFEETDGDLYQLYEALNIFLSVSIYRALRQRHNGPFATNQDKYVPGNSKLNSSDDRTMEDLMKSIFEPIIRRLWK